MATDRNPQVMEMVEEELREDPEISNSELKERAEEIDEEIGSLSARQFNARYPLQVKRKLADDRRGASGDGSGDDGSGPESAATGSGEQEGAAPSEETRERVFQMIEEALDEDPEISNDELQERAAEIDPAIGDLTARSFHARYPLQVKRQMTAGRKKNEESGDEAEGTGERGELRSAAREALIDFARAVAGAGDRGEVIDVLTSVDEYVDRVMEKA